MPSITSLAAKLSIDFPNYQFIPSSEFHWSPLEKTIFYNQGSKDSASLLHELSHALLGHEDYIKDIGLIEIERDAWQYASNTLAALYDTPISDEIVQDALDTYRDWLHARSTCPECTATGIQTKKSIYKCLACSSRWHVNDARICALRRHTL